MIVGAVAAAQAAIYLCAIPLHFAFAVSILDAPRFSTGLAAFSPAAARMRSRDRRSPPRRRKHRPGGAHTLGYLRRLRVDAIRLCGSASLGDAAATALLCGALNAAGCLAATRAQRADILVRPDFRSPGVSLEVEGMITARSGQIIWAVIQTEFYRIQGRFHPWKDIRSRIS